MAMPPIHPACAVFPILSDEDLCAMADDIQQNGLRDAITLTLVGELLDGKNRWKACEIAGVEPHTETYSDHDPIAFVLSKNKHHRHLSKSQMAMIAARLSNLPKGRPNKITFSEGIYSLKQLAKQADTTTAYVQWGRRLLKSAEPHIIRMVDNDEVNIHCAAEAIGTADRLTQANWTKQDVEREGMKIIRAYPSNLAKQSKAPQPLKTTHPPKQKQEPRHPLMNAQGVIDPPYRGGIPTLTQEEIGLAPNATLEEKWEHAEKYGRVQLAPKAVLDMQKHNGAIEDLLIGLASLAADRHISPEQVFAAIDEMLAWVPQKDLGNGWGTDYAAKARAHLKTLGTKLPVALERLTELTERLRSSLRKDNDAASDEAFVSYLIN